MGSTERKRLNPIWAIFLVGFKLAWFAIRTGGSQGVRLNYGTGEVTPLERDK